MDTYGNEIARDMTLDRLKVMLMEKGVKRLFIKHLSPNDNSKNQPYFGGDYSVLNMIPTGDIQVMESTSNKKTGGPHKVIFRASINFTWIDPVGNVHPAPNAKLILYPQYPEVRFSGFLQGSTVKMSEWMAPEKQGRSEGRILIIGLTDSSEVIGYLAAPNSQLASELILQPVLSSTGVFDELNLRLGQSSEDENKNKLLIDLRAIHLEGWIQSRRLKIKDGNVTEVTCESPNCGGYTLEAKLGITPNGYSEPDYLGWELKQFGVQRFDRIDSKVVTLMTPEPTGGVYKDDGVRAFLEKFGYADLMGRPDRINFGGIHKCGIRHDRTELTLKLDGYDHSTGKITDPSSGMVLEAESGEVAAIWHYSGLMEHWKRKHNQAAYIPSQSRNDSGREYRFGNSIKLGEGTEFSHFLRAINSGDIYYDPGIKMEAVSSGSPKIKRRSQFRIKTGSLSSLYSAMNVVNLME